MGGNSTCSRSKLKRRGWLESEGYIYRKIGLKTYVQLPASNKECVLVVDDAKSAGDQNVCYTCILG